MRTKTVKRIWFFEPFAIRSIFMPIFIDASEINKSLLVAVFIIR